MIKGTHMAGATNLVDDLAVSPEVPPSADAAPEVLSTAGLSAEMAAQLAVVLGAVGAGGLSGVDSEQALRVVEAVETVKAWADSVSVEATAVLVAELESEHADLAPDDPTPRQWRRFLGSCRSAAAREIQVATGLPISACQRRVWLSACEPERAGPVREAMRRGKVSFARAVTLAEKTAHLDGFLAAAIAARVLRPLTGPDGLPLPGAAPLSQATFNARLHRQLVLHHGLVRQAERTYQEALKARCVQAQPNPEGTGSLLISGDGPRIAAAAGRVDQIARRLRQGGDARTLAQLRADVATDLLLRGWIPTDPTFAALGQPPPAQVQLIVSLPTLLGAEQGVGQIPGWGTISAQQARALALAAGSIWKRVVTDPATGRAIEVSARTYQVPAGMSEQVKTRDGTCRAPGCQIPAEHADLDHTEEWKPDGAGGPTAQTNLAALHRGHHNLKTAGFWDSDQAADGTLTWTTATGRTITTYPHIYDHPDHLPVHTSPLETRHGTRLAQILNPDIPLPGHLNIFEHIDWAQTLAPATPQPPQHTRATTRTSHHQPAATAVPAVDDAPPPF